MRDIQRLFKAEEMTIIVSYCTKNACLKCSWVAISPSEDRRVLQLAMEVIWTLSSRIIIIIMIIKVSPAPRLNCYL